MHGPVIEAHIARAINPGQRVLHPVLVIAIRVVLASMRAAALQAIRRRFDRCSRVEQQVLELDRLDEIRIPDQRTIATATSSKLVKVLRSRSTPSSRTSPVRNTAAWSCMTFCISRRISAVGRAAVCIAQPVDARNAVLPGILGQRLVARTRRHRLGAEMRGRTAEYNQVEQRIGTQAIGAVNRNTGRLADGHQALDN